MENTFGVKMNRIGHFVDNLVYDVARLQSNSHEFMRQSRGRLNSMDGHSTTAYRSNVEEINLNSGSTLFPPEVFEKSDRNRVSNRTFKIFNKHDSHVNNFATQINSIREMMEEIREKQERTDRKVGSLCENTSPMKLSVERDKDYTASSKNFMQNTI